MLGRLEAFGRPSPAAVRWPAALAGIIAGWMIARSMDKALGLRAGVLFGICWFGSLALIDRSAATGLDLILGLATLASIDRLITRGSDRVAGLWAALAFLAGGWPAAGRDRPGDHRHRQDDREATRSRCCCRRSGTAIALVVLDNLGFLRRGLGGLAHSSSDAEASLDARAASGRPRASLEPVRHSGAQPFGARRLDSTTAARG